MRRPFPCSHAASTKLEIANIGSIKHVKENEIMPSVSAIKHRTSSCDIGPFQAAPDA